MQLKDVTVSGVARVGGAQGLGYQMAPPPAPTPTPTPTPTPHPHPLQSTVGY